MAVTNSFLENPLELIHVNMDNDSKNLNPWGRKVWKSYTGLAFYREMPVAVKQFNEGVSQAEVEHEANIISSFNQAKPFMLLLQF